MHHIDVRIEKDIYDVNTTLAAKNAKHLKSHGVRAFDLLGAIGSGKTALIERLNPQLVKKGLRAGGIAGDLYGDDDFKRIVALGIPRRSTNRERSLRDVVSPFYIYDLEGLRIAVIGMGNQDTISSTYEGGNSLGFRPIEDWMALQNYTNMLRPIVDVIVVVSHIGLDADEGLTAAEADDQNITLPGVDLILGGHLHIVTNPPKLLPNDDGSEYCKTNNCQTLLVHSGAFAKFVGRLDLVVRVGSDNNDPEKRSRIVSFAYKNLPVEIRPTSTAGGSRCLPFRLTSGPTWSS